MADSAAEQRPQDHQSCEPRRRPRRKRTSEDDFARTLPAPRLLGLEEAAGYLSLSYWSVRAMVEAGTLPRVRIPGVRRYLVDRSDLDRLVDAWKERD